MDGIDRIDMIDRGRPKVRVVCGDRLWICYSERADFTLLPLRRKSAANRPSDLCLHAGPLNAAILGGSITVTNCRQTGRHIALLQGLVCFVVVYLGDAPGWYRLRRWRGGRGAGRCWEMVAAPAGAQGYIIV